MHEKFSLDIETRQQVALLVQQIEKKLAKNETEEAEKIAQAILEVFVQENLRQLPDVNHEVANEQVRQFRLFTSFKELFDFVEEKNGAQTASEKFRIALASTNGGLSSMVTDVSTKRKIPVVLSSHNAFHRFRHDLSAVGLFRSRGEVMIEELKHAADNICGMINPVDMKSAKFITKLLYANQAITMWGYTALKSPELAISPDSLIAWGLFASSLITSGLLIRRYSQVPHEERARSLAKEVARVPLADKLKKFISP